MSDGERPEGAASHSPPMDGGARRVLGDFVGAAEGTATMTATARTDAKASRACVHHWVIESPHGRESTGVCKHCGRTRSFANATESVMWEQTNTLRSSPASGLRHLPRPDTTLLSDEILID